MDFWNSTLTEKSWKILQDIKKDKFSFILIGGWAAYLWTKLHKSKDIDIVLKDFKDLDYLKNNYNLIKNDDLKRYEIKFEEIDLDIYVPFFSKLAIPPEELKNHTTIIENLEVVTPEALLILKQGVEYDRKDSVKGEKDRVDILTLLLYTDINLEEYSNLLNQYQLEHFYGRLKEIILNFKEINYLNMNPRQFKLKKEGLLRIFQKPAETQNPDKFI